MTSTMRFDRWENPAATQSVTFDQLVGGTGLVPVVAPTIRVSGSSATVNSLGTVSFTNASSIQLDGVFTGTDNFYQVVTKTTYSTSAGGWYYLTSNGAIANGANYNINQVYGGGSTVTSAGAQNATYFPYLPIAGNSASGTTLISYPGSATITHFYHNAVLDQTTNSATIVSSGQHRLSLAYDGIHFGASAGTMTGTITVYRYNS